MVRRTSRFSWITTVILCGALASAHICAMAAAPSPEVGRTGPAKFSEAAISALASAGLELGEDEQAIAVRCAVKLRANGGTGRVLCYPDAERPDLALRLGRRVVSVVQQQRLEPAMLEGERVRAWLNFSVVVFRADGATQIRALPNHGVNVAALGTADYSAPQRISFPRWTCVGGGARRGSNFAIGTARISAEGEVTRVRLAESELNARCVQTIERVIRSSRYLPAFVDGEPREAIYTEIFYTP